MIEAAWSELASGEWRARRAAATIGVFDGLHRGHQALIARIREEPDLLPVVVTFQRHPAEILGNRTFGFVMSIGQRRRVLADLGIEVTVLVDFTHEFSRLPGREFLARLADSFRLDRLVVGHDFVCGHDLDTDVAAARRYLEPLGTEVIPVGPVTDGVGTAVISSTRIRELLRAGRVEEAGMLLGRPFALDVGDEATTVCEERVWIPIGPQRLLPASSQIVPVGGSYQADLVDPTGKKRSTTLEIREKSLSWPLSAGHPIRYIVMKHRTLAKE